MHACSSRAGEVLAWGINDFGQLGTGSDVQLLCCAELRH